MKKPKLPRVRLPKQTGGAHRDRTKEPARKRKHRFDVEAFDAIRERLKLRD